jgi:hypothetical protein
MNTFSAQTESDAVVPASRSDIWAALTDPDLLPRLTPFLEHIQADGDTWRWELSKIPILGVAIAPCFTEQMTFDPETRIEYRHAPPAGAVERTGVEGWYQLDESVDGEWSFIQTLRHLVFATDAWVLRAVFGNPSPWDPLDLPHDDMEDAPGVPRDRAVQPSLPASESFPVARCLGAVINEEWEHRLYAERDLAALDPSRQA